MGGLLKLIDKIDALHKKRGGGGGGWSWRMKGHN